MRLPSNWKTGAMYTKFCENFTALMNIATPPVTFKDVDVVSNPLCPSPM